MRSLLLGLCLVVAGVFPAHAAKRVALVIGNSGYTLLSPLSNPVNDAALMAAALREVGFEVIESKDADQRTIKRAIRDFGKRLRRAGADAVGLFYYAGHGVQALGENYLIPLDAPIVDEADLEIEAVEASWVLRQMESAGNGLNIVILDACRNNPFAGSFRTAGRGLARMDAPTGSLVAYSAAPGQVAADGRGGNSPYTEALVKAMREPGLDLLKVFQRTRIAVQATTAGAQTPWEEQSLLGDFYFVPPAATAVPATAPAASAPVAAPAFDVRAVELTFWESIKDSSNPAVFESYLAQYPKGIFSGLAKVKIAELEETETAALTPPAALTPGFTVSELDETYYAVKRSNLRAGPGTGFSKVGRLAPGDEIEVTGKVAGKNWYRIAMADGGQAFVFAPLLTDRKPAETQVAVGVYPDAGRQPGETFRDCAGCPEMVVIPPGRFRMGDLSGAGDDPEKPVHAVTIGYQFAVGKFEVTRGEYAAFQRAKGRHDGGSCWTYESGDWEDRTGRSWRDPGFRQGERDPVVCVTWDDAQAYVRWLSGKTGQAYRLLSEAEWEYAARAGTTTTYNTGSSISKGEAKFGSGDGTVRVGFNSPNAFGLYDVHGNVWEWTEDCWHDSYHGAASDGGAWTTGGGMRQACWARRLLVRSS